MRYSLGFGLLYATCTPALALAGDAPPPLFGDWWTLMPDGWRAVNLARDTSSCGGFEDFVYDQPSSYVPVNQPGGGHGGPTYERGTWMADYAICFAEHLASVGAPVSFMMRNGNCPIPYADPSQISPDVLAIALDELPRLDYLIMDLEPWGEDGDVMVEINIDEIVQMVRSHPNPDIANAFIGNYDDYPGSRDEANIWPGLRDRNDYRGFNLSGWDRELLYNSYLNVAMPSAYPYEAYSRHSDTAIQGDATTPNDRAAIFWAPLERVSNAARNLPEGHLLIPWVSNFVGSSARPEFYHAPPPAQADLAAFMQHTRLRGAHSFMVWTSDNGDTVHPGVTYDRFRELAMHSWSILDPSFDSADSIEYLNLETDKRSGLNWSGIRIGNDVIVLVSNLHNSEAQAARLPEIDGLPEFTEPVPANSHRWFGYSVDAAARDFDRDGDLDPHDFLGFVNNFMAGGNPADFVGGKGTFPVDVNTDGSLDVNDLMLVADAYRAGKYGNSSHASGRSSNESRSTRTASAPTE